MNRKEKITFVPQTGNSGKNRVPRYVWIIAVSAVIVGLLSFFVILAMNDFELSRVLGIRQTELPEETTAAPDGYGAEALEGLTDAVNFLAVCGDGNELSFCLIVSVKPSDALIRIKPVSGDCVLEYPSGAGALSDLYRRGEIGSITAGFSAKSIPIARYVIISEENFISLLQRLGPVDAELENDFEFSVDAIKHKYSAGKVAMSAEGVLSYMKTAAKGDELLRMQAKTAADIIRTHFTQENTEKGDAFFAELINLVNTDITVFDYTPAAGVIKAMAAQGIEISVIS